MAYSDCPQVDILTTRLVEAYREMSESEIEAGDAAKDLHLAIMEHKAGCSICKRMTLRQSSAVGQKRVA